MNSLSLITRMRMLLAVLIVLAINLLCAAAYAASVDPDAARGKRLVYVYNQTKLEKAKAAIPPPADPARIPTLERWRSNDRKAIEYLQSLGFIVTANDEFSPVETTAGKDLIVISESVDALEIGIKYRNTPVPLVTFENDLLGELAMTGLKIGRDTGTDDNQRFLWLVNAPHPLAAGLPAGIQNVLDDENLKMNWGKPGLGAITIATLRGEPDKAAIFAYERGATMNGEAIAPARRVSFFLWQDTFQHLRPEGLALFRAAVLWAVAPPQ